MSSERKLVVGLTALLGCVATAIAVVLAGQSTAATSGGADAGGNGSSGSTNVERVAVTFSGGHDTVRVDGGRPVILIAGALDVKPEVFRDAFSGVRPSRNGPPSGDRARQNKQVLMSKLAPHGVTNDRLDEVSNYYRYRPQAGEMWPHDDAEAFALIEDGKIVGFEIKDGGHGYSSPPTVTVRGFGSVPVEVTVSYGTDFEQNGVVTAIELRP